MANRDHDWGVGAPRERRGHDENDCSEGERDDASRFGGYGGYGGEEYGVEGGPAHARPDRGPEPRDEDQRETWRPGGGAPYGDLELNARNRGVEDYGPPHDYAYHPHAGHEFDTDCPRGHEEPVGRDREAGHEDKKGRT